MSTKLISVVISSFLVAAFTTVTFAPAGFCDAALDAAMRDVVTPSDQTVLSWSPAERGDFLSEARVRKEHAQERLEKAQELLKRAEWQNHSLLALSIAYGESTEQFRERQLAGKEKVSELLRPNEQFVSDCQQALMSADAVLNSCIIAERGLDGGWRRIGQ